MLLVARYRDGDGKRGGHSVTFGKIEALFDCAGCNIKKHRIVGEILRNQQLFMAGRAQHRNRRRVRHALVALQSTGQFGFSPRR